MRILTIVVLFGALAIVQTLWAPRCLAADAPLDTILPNGVRIIAQRETETQLVAINVFIRVGAAEETDDIAGVGNFVAGTLLSGTSNQDQDTMAREIGTLGGNITAVWQPDMTQIKALTLVGQFDEASYFLSDVLKNANFPDAAVEFTRHDLLVNIQNQSDDYFTTTYENMRSVLYKATPYAYPTLGDPATIRRLTSADLRSFFGRYYTADNIVISVVGNVDPNHVADEFEQNLADFTRRNHRPAPSSQSDLDVVTPLDQPELIKRYRPDLAAGYVMIGYLAPGAGSKDYPAMLVANTLLGGMKTSLLFTQVREKRGLGYEVASVFANQLHRSDLIAYSVSEATQVDPVTKKDIPAYPAVRDALLDQFRQMRETPPTDVDLERAKRYLIGSYLVSHRATLGPRLLLGILRNRLETAGRVSLRYALCRRHQCGYRRRCPKDRAEILQRRLCCFDAPARRSKHRCSQRLAIPNRNSNPQFCPTCGILIPATLPIDNPVLTTTLRGRVRPRQFVRSLLRFEGLD